MAIYTRLLINGSDYNDVENISISSTISENNAVSSCDIKFDNYGGFYSDIFNVGNTVSVYADKDANPATTLRFGGVIKDISFKGKDVSEKLSLSCADYSSRLQDVTIKPTVFLNQNIGSIIYNVVSGNLPEINTSGVAYFDKTVSRIAYNHIPIYDAIKQLSEQVGAYFYVSPTKTLHFETLGSISSGYTFYSGNYLISADFRESDQELANDVWVYGDRYLTAWENRYVQSGTGSVFSTSYKPHNVSVSVAGVLYQGGIEHLSTTQSGVQYLVDFDQRTVTFTSGTNCGDNIPASGAGSPIIILYQRDLPIVAIGEDPTSIESYGRRRKVIVDTNIRDVSTAFDFMRANLDLCKEPKKEGNLELQGVVSLTPGQTCIVDIPTEGINSETLNINEVTYEFNAENNYAETVMGVKVSQKLKNILDVIKSIILKQKKAEESEMSDALLYSRYSFSAGSIGTALKSVYVSYRQYNYPASGLMWDSPAYGIWDVNYWDGIGGSGWSERQYLYSGGTFT